MREATVGDGVRGAETVGSALIRRLVDVRGAVAAKAGLDLPGRRVAVGIVEEGSPNEAVTDPMLWYKAGGSKEKYEENFAKMIESVQAFLDISQLESHPTSEYIIKA